MDLHYSNKRKTTLASFKEKVQNKMLYKSIFNLYMCWLFVLLFRNIIFVCYVFAAGNRLFVGWQPGWVQQVGQKLNREPGSRVYRMFTGIHVYLRGALKGNTGRASSVYGKRCPLFSRARGVRFS